MWCEKDENKQKEAGIGEFLKKYENYSLRLGEEEEGMYVRSIFSRLMVGNDKQNRPRIPSRLRKRLD